MTKAYLIAAYRAVHDAEKVAAYARLAAPAVAAAGGRFLARGPAIAAHEEGRRERTVIVAFDDVASALEIYGSPAYRAALAVLDGGAERDIRIVEGLD